MPVHSLSSPTSIGSEDLCANEAVWLAMLQQSSIGCKSEAKLKSMQEKSFLSHSINFWLVTCHATVFLNAYQITF
jgi:hypothetical protein